MNSIRRWLAGLTALGAATAFAVESKPVRIRFLPPPLEGNIYLAVYDAAGRRVRTLCDDCPVDRFETARDGLEAVWDGSDDHGTPLPPGRYSVRGTRISPLRVERVEIRWCPWPNPASAPRFTRILDLGLCAPERMVLLAESVDGTVSLAGVSRKGDIAWLNRLGAGPAWIASESGGVFVSTAGRVDSLDATDGSVRASVPGVSGQIGIDQTRLWVATKDGIRSLRRPDVVTESSIEESPPLLLRVDNLVSGPEGVLFLADGRLLEQKHSALRPWTPALPDPVRAAAGRSRSTVWTLAGRSLQQVSREGELLRVLEQDPDSPIPTRVAAGPTGRELALLSERQGRQIVQWIRQIASAEGESMWEPVLELRWPAQGPFAIRNGDPVESETESTSVVRVELVPDPFNPHTVPVANLEARVGFDQVLVVDEQGVPFHRLPKAGVRQAWLGATGRNGAAILVVRDGAVLERWSLEGLDQAARFDCGTYELAP